MATGVFVRLSWLLRCGVVPVESPLHHVVTMIPCRKLLAPLLALVLYSILGPVCRNLNAGFLVCPSVRTDPERYPYDRGARFDPRGGIAHRHWNIRLGLLRHLRNRPALTQKVISFGSGDAGNDTHFVRVGVTREKYQPILIVHSDP
jgi:hypothetical protein